MLSGATHYRTGKPCSRGHVAERYAVSGNCVRCMTQEVQGEGRKAYNKRYRSTPEYREAENKRRLLPWVAAVRRRQNLASQSTPHGRDRQLQHVAKRRALKLGAPGSHTMGDRRTILLLQGGACHYCAEAIEFSGSHHDHFIPLTKGGSDARFNIVMACPRCNLRKHNKAPIEFAGFTVKMPVFWNEGFEL